MTRQLSPFIFNAPVPPHRFIGRRPQLEQIMGQLTGPARVSSAISGDPRVGKTSLLHHLCAPQVHKKWGLSSEWCHFLYIDCHSIVPFSEAAFWRFTLRELGQHLHDNETLTMCVQTVLNQTNPDIFDLNTLFDQMARAGRLAVLILDEFEGIIENLDPRSPELLYHLRALLNRPERGLVVLTASREPLKNLCTNIHFAGSPFDNCFSPITLPPFSEAEVDELFNQYQIHFSAIERTFVHRVAGVQPYLVQLAGALVMRTREQKPLAEADLVQIEADLERDTESYFINILNYSSPVEKILLTWLALTQLNRQLPPDLFKLGQLPKTLGRYDQDLKRLIERGLVQHNPNGLALFSSILGRWVLYKALVTAGQEVLTEWQGDYVNFLSTFQQKAFKNLAKKILQCPAAVANPALLLELPVTEDQSSSTFTESSFTNSIRLSGPLFLPEQSKREIIKQLYAQNDQLNVAQVRLEQEFQGGLSGAQMLLVQPIDSKGRVLAYEVVKIAPATILRREHNRYQRFVRGRLPATAVRLENGPLELGTLGCLSYGFAGDRPIGAIKDMETYYATHNAGDVVNTLRGLMNSLDARWYGQSEPLSASFADEYDQQLPAHLWLLAEQITPSRSITSDCHRSIDIETILHTPERLNIGERVALSGLEISQVAPDKIKLRSIDDGATIWVNATVTLPYLDLHEQQQVSVLGIVENSRDDILNAASVNILNFAPNIQRQSGHLKLPGAEHPYPYPLAIYKQVLQQQLNGRRSIIHGDLHPGNILVDEEGRAWLIDFDHVREAHVLFDFVRLETILRLFVLGGVRRFKKQDKTSPLPPPPMVWPHPFTLAEYVTFETSLAQQTLGYSALEIDQPDLAKAAKVIMAIRDLARHYLRQRNHWSEYFAGLFLQNLAQLRFYQNQPWLGVLPFTTAALVGREIQG